MREFSPMSKYTFSEVEHIFWSMRDSVGEESALTVLNGLGLNPIERLLLVRDLLRYGEAVSEENESGWQG